MTFRQHQKFLSASKKYYSCFPTIPYSKYSSSHFHSSNFILKNFQFWIKKSYTLNSFKHGILKKQKMCFPFECFLSLRIRNSWLPFGPFHQIYLSSYFIRGLTCISDKKYYQIIKNSQLTDSFFFYKQAFAFQAYHSKQNYTWNITIQNFITFTNQTQINTLVKRRRFTRNSLKGILLVNFPEKEKNFLIKNLAAENKIALITQSASLLLKDSRNMDDLLGVDDPIQILFDRVKTCLPCICFINNLDSIGKQRYEQQHKSLHRLNSSISSLIDYNLSHDRISETMNQKEKFDLPTVSLSNKVSLLDHNFKKMTILKNLKTIQVERSFLMLDERRASQFSFKNWRFMENEPSFYPLWVELVTRFRNIQSKNQTILKYLTWFEQSPIKNQLQPIKPFFNLLIKLSMGSKDFMYTNLNKQSFLQFSTEKNIPPYYHRLPFWLSASAELRKNHFFPKYKVGINKMKLFKSFDHTKNEKENILRSRQLKINTLPLQMAFSGIQSNKTGPIFAKTAEYNMVDPKTNLENTHIIYSRPLFKNSLIKSDSTQIFENTLKPVSKINRYYLTLSKKRFDFKYLGKISIDQKEIFKTSLNSSKQSIIFGASVFSYRSVPNRAQSAQYVSLFLKNKNKDTQNRFKNDHLFSINRQFLNNSRDEKQLISARAEPRKLSKTGKYLNFSTGELSKDFEKHFKDQPINNKFTRLTTFDRLSTTARELNKNNSLKITETEIIKRTALLKFLQILDGFHTTTGKKKSISFFSLSMFQLETQTKDMSVLKTDFQHEYSELLKKIIMYKMILSKKIKPKSSKYKTNDKSALSIKNFLTPLVLKKKEKHSNTVIMNLIHNNRWFSTVTRSKKLKKIQKYSTYSAVMFSKSKNDLLGYALTKKSFPSFSLANKVPKWELYLKNQPVSKSLNLLCVWPSYIEEILGPFNLNDGASYLLPEYFQLLGHGPKLKKQGITLIASTNNLTTLDAALLRPGRFDTIINFFHSLSSTHRGYRITKHSPSLGFALSPRLLRLFWNKQEFPFHNKRSLTQNKISSLSESSIKEKEIVDLSIWPFKFLENSIVNEKQKNFLVFLRGFARAKKNTDFLFNNTIFTPSFPSTNMFNMVKNQFDPQVTVLDIPSQSLPIKAFIDVSIFIQYKLWWSFKSEKLSPFGLYQTDLIQKKTGASDSEKFKIKSSSTNSVELVLKSKTFKDWIGAFNAIFYLICFKISTMFKVKFTNSKTMIDNWQTNHLKSSRKTFINQNSNLVNRLGRELLISKAVADLYSSLPFDLSKSSALTQASINPNRGKEPLRSLTVSDGLNINASYSTWGLPKNSSLLNGFLDQYYESKNEVWTLSNDTDKTVKSFTSHFHMEHDNSFLKFNRSLLFCIGDFDYKTYSEKDFDFILKKQPWEEKQHFFSSSHQNQIKNIGQPQSTSAIKNKTALNFHLNNKRKKNTFLGSEFGYSTQSIDVTTAFLDQSSKVWKDSGKATIMKNVNINCVRLTKYNKIYKLKKIKLKQQSFFNLHPFTSFMIKRWPKVTKPNKLKTHLKVPLASVFSELENTNSSPFLKNKNGDAAIGLPWKNQIHGFLKSGESFSINDHFSPGYLNHDLNYRKNSNTSLKKNDDPIKANIKKQLNFSFHQENQQNFSVIPSYWFSNFDLKSLYTQIYHNLYSATLLMPNPTLLLKKQSLKTLETNGFFSTYESYFFRKLTTNSSLNITCLQINSTLVGSQFIASPILYSLEQKKVSFLQQAEPDLIKEINIFGLENQTTDAFVFSGLPKNTETNKFFSCKSSTWKNWISRIRLLKTENRLKKIPRKTIINKTHNDIQTIYKLKYFNTVTNQLEMNNNIMLLKNFVLNEKNQQNRTETRKSYFQRYKMYKAPLGVKRQAEQWGGTQLDTSFFLLIFYTMFFEKIQQKKMLLTSIKIFMPYRSLIFSHFLLSQGETYGFSCKNFEILVYNKFKNFLVDF